MNSESLRKKLEGKEDNAQQIAKAATKDTSLLSYILDGISSPNSRVRFKCAKALRIISEENPEMLYPHFGFFRKLLDSENNILRWNAIDIIANLATVDSNNMFGRLFGEFYGLLNEGSLITAAHVVDNSAKIIRAKPHLERRITNELLRIEKISLPTEECRHIITGKVITAFGQYFDQSKNKDIMLSFARNQLNSTRPSTKRRAEQFLRRFSS